MSQVLDKNPIIDPEAPPTDKLVALLDLGAEMCRWPVGDVREPGFGFCGHHAPIGSYCPYHSRLSYGGRAPVSRPYGA